jgi:dTDP-4-amino-4,6-dideoxygalactose transaminase
MSVGARLESSHAGLGGELHIEGGPLKVPPINLAAQYESIKSELDEAVGAVMASGMYVQGAEVEKLEEEYARYIGTAHAVACSSGTTALKLALMAAGVGPGDEVITAANTFIATAGAIIHAGAKPVFADVDPITCNMDPGALEGALTDKTKAIIPVHLYGHAMDMDPVVEIAKDRGLVLLEDAAQAHGATYKGTMAGSIGHAGCFSFYPTKNLGACGEAGAVVTNSSEMARKMKLLRDHGSESKYVHGFIGYNDRMDALQASILRVKLRHLDDWVDARRSHGERYNSALEEVPVETPQQMPYAKAVYHLYVIRCSFRDKLAEFLKSRDVGVAFHYPVPLHMQPALAHLGYKQGDFPVAERHALRLLSLPMFPELTPDQVSYVCEVVEEGARQFAPSGAADAV